MPSYRFLYFDGRGAGEVSRLLFSVGGLEFEDKRYPLNFGTPGDFSTMTRPEFDADKAAGKFASNAGRLPILEITDGSVSTSVGQSKSIERYIAKQCGLMGSSDVQALQIDALTEQIRDVKDAYSKAKREDPENGKKKFMTDTLPAKLGEMESMMPEDEASWPINYADVAIYYFLSQYFDLPTDDAASACPKLQASANKAKSNAKLQEWEAKRNPTPF